VSEIPRASLAPQSVRSQELSGISARSSVSRQSRGQSHDSKKRERFSLATSEKRLRGDHAQTTGQGAMKIHPELIRALVVYGSQLAGRSRGDKPERNNQRMPRGVFAASAHHHLCDA